MVGNEFRTKIFIWVQKKQVWENTLTKQVRAIKPIYITKMPQILPESQNAPATVDSR